jgi:tRNA nucleotidyltransferase (CCA-adding enzyme)
MFISQFQQPIHPLAIKICLTLQEAGYQAFIVGGCVRDLYLNITPKDWDITTSATPEQVIQLFSRTIPTGLQHGTVTVCMDEGAENHFEVTTFRVEGKYLDGRRPEEVHFVQNVEEDLARRDLTINAMAYDPVNNIIVDPFNGWQDLQDGVIRAVGNPMERFQEDGLRIMRVARFAARFGYDVDEATQEGMKASLETLKKVSRERMKDELCKTIMAVRPSYGLNILEEVGALKIVCPLASQIFWFIHYPLEGELETRLAFLYHKYDVKSVEQELLFLKMSNKEVKRIRFLLGLLEDFENYWLDSTVINYRQFIAKIKNEAPAPWEHTLSQFVKLTRALGAPIQEWLDQHQNVVVYARRELAIDGIDLMAHGFAAGPVLKMLLDGCYLEILEHPENNNREYLLNMVVKRLL